MPLSYSFHSIYSSILSIWNIHSWTYLSLLALLLCRTPVSQGIYIYPLLSLFSQLGNSILSVDWTFPLFMITAPYFLISDSVPMSWLKTSTVGTNPLISFSLFPHSFNSSINRRWLFFHLPRYMLPWLCVVHELALTHITDNKGDKLWPWKISLLMLDFVKLSSHRSTLFGNLPLIFLQIRGWIHFPVSRNGNHIISFLIINPCHSQICMSLPTITQYLLIN